MSQKCVWDFRVTDWRVVTRPVTDQWSVNVMSLFTENFHCLILIVDVYCRLTRRHFTRKDLQISEKPQNFPLEHFTLYGMSYMLYIAITLLVIIKLYLHSTAS